MIDIDANADLPGKDGLHAAERSILEALRDANDGRQWMSAMSPHDVRTVARALESLGRFRRQRIESLVEQLTDGAMIGAVKVASERMAAAGGYKFGDEPAEPVTVDGGFTQRLVSGTNIDGAELDAYVEETLAFVIDHIIRNVTELTCDTSSDFAAMIRGITTHALLTGYHTRRLEVSAR